MGKNSTTLDLARERLVHTDPMGWFHERQMRLDRQHFKNTIIVVLLLTSLGIMLPLMGPGLEGDPRKLIRPGLLITGDIFLLLSWIAREKNQDKQSTYEVFAVLGVFFTLFAPGFTYAQDWFATGFSVIVFFLVGSSLVGLQHRNLIITIAFLILGANYLLVSLGWRAGLVIPVTGIRADAGDGLARMGTVIIGCFFVVWQNAKTQSNKDKLLMEITELAVSSKNVEKRFLSDMSHEVRNPLNSLLGMLDVLWESVSMNNADRKNLEVARHSGFQIRSLIDDILDYQNFKETGVVLNEKVFDFHKFEKILNLEAAAIARHTNINFRVLTDIDSLPRFLIGDARRIKQLAMNIIGNSIKFTERGEISVSLKYKSNRLMVKVEDTGIGMSPETLESIYERHFRGERASNFGSGLGLTISKSIVDAMGGDISFESEVGKGTKVSIELPLRVGIPSPEESDDGDGKDVDRKLATGLNDEGNRTELIPKEAGNLDLTVLFVDDQELNLKVYSKLLSIIGISSITAESGEIALQKIEDEKPELVISDINMPEMNGLELLEKLRASNPDLPVIAITGNVLEEDVQDYYEAGFDKVLSKPVDKAKLFETIREFAPRIKANKRDTDKITN